LGRIGLLGGAFNPIHNGHLRLAIEALERLGLEEVELLPTAVPPHKPGAGILPFALRLAMAEAAVAGCPGLSVNPVEAERPGPSYTVETLRRLAAASRPGEEFVFILGVGELLALPGWKEGLTLPELAHLAVAGRAEAEMHEREKAETGAAHLVAEFVARHWPGADDRCPACSAGKDGRTWCHPSGRRIFYLDVPRLDISGSQVRAKWLAGERIRGLVPEGVERLLAENALLVREVWS